MRILCPHCGGKAVISSRHTLTPTVADLYCQCRNVQACGASFVLSLALKHTLNPPINVTAQLALSVIRALPKDERAKLGSMGDLFDLGG